MKVKPIGERLLVEPKDETEDTSEGGIIIPEMAKEKPRIGVIKAVGQLDVDLKVGDTIMYGKFAGADSIAVDGVECIIMDISHVMAKLED